MDAIQTISLTKQYKDVIAVNHLNLTVRAGELFALLGVNGAGKTTLIKMLCGLTRPTDGTALLNGKNITTQATEIKHIIGISPQETAVAPNLSVRENLTLICGLHSFSGQKTAKKIEELTDRFQLNSILRKKAGTLSGGYQRRLSIAMALIGEPQILFLDEPTLGLDVIARSELWDNIRTLKGKTTIVLTTHYMEEAEALSDRIGILKNGTLLALGTADALKKSVGSQRFEDAFVSIIKGASV